MMNRSWWGSRTTLITAAEKAKVVHDTANNAANALFDHKSAVCIEDVLKSVNAGDSFF